MKKLNYLTDLVFFYNQWGYTPTGLCASITENALYLVQMFEEGYSVYGKNIYKYNVETKNDYPILLCSCC